MVQPILNFPAPVRSEAINTAPLESTEASPRGKANNFEAELASTETRHPAQSDRPAEPRAHSLGNRDFGHARREIAHDARLARSKARIDARCEAPVKPGVRAKPQSAPHCDPDKPEMPPNEGADAGNDQGCRTPICPEMQGAEDPQTSQIPIQAAFDPGIPLTGESASVPVEIIGSQPVVPLVEIQPLPVDAVISPVDGFAVSADATVDEIATLLSAGVPAEAIPVEIDPTAITANSSTPAEALSVSILPAGISATSIGAIAGTGPVATSLPDARSVDPVGVSSITSPMIGSATAGAEINASVLAEQLLSRSLVQEAVAGKIAVGEVSPNAPGSDEVTPDTLFETGPTRGKAEAVSSQSSLETATGTDKGVSHRQPLNYGALRSSFADLVNDFAGAHGANHRSGDFIGGLERAAIVTAANGAAGADALRPTPLQVLPIEIGMQAARGVTRFQIRLDPAELGRVDVQLDIRDNGEVHANLIVDRVETLAMLKRDASTLQYAFEQAGLKQSADGLSFSLRGENQQGQNTNREGGQQQRGRQNEGEPVTVPNAQIADFAMRRVLIPNSSIDRVV